MEEDVILFKETKNCKMDRNCNVIIRAGEGDNRTDYKTGKNGESLHRHKYYPYWHPVNRLHDICRKTNRDWIDLDEF